MNEEPFVTKDGLTLSDRQLNELIDDRAYRQALLRQIADDYDRRMQHWWGRFLLWLLRKTT